MTRLKLGLSHLRNRKFKKFSGRSKIFFEPLDRKLKRRRTIYSTVLNIETKELTSSIKSKILPLRILEKADYILSQISLLDSLFDYFISTFIINSTAQYLLGTKRF